MTTKEEQIYYDALNKQINEAEHRADTKRDEAIDKMLKNMEYSEVGEQVMERVDKELINEVIETSKILWKVDYPEGSRGYNLKQSNQFIIYVQKQLGAGKHEFELFNELINI